ncbi:phage virion morphogenesis protein [Asticcacaulis machinosus]|uniref:Phage virion morphogenesis protein n=1 Tax=Asticcacaulis machinosus TaxID=2984211 RepID=A0ABT5HGJ5_9CAUL|nr:phage virion morphogenesis protein [Asticcacaulis machinosus]MDC7675373.1 phage virion morphogenesis protein [Asticcacaulis machinosus]
MSELRALEELEAIVSGLLRDLSSPGRRQLMRKVARDVRKSQSDRIKAQKNPDGSAFEARRPKPKPSMGNYAVHFLYPSGGSGPPRAVLMKSWMRDGQMLTGYDIEAGGIRSFFWDKIIKWLGVSPDDQNKSGGKIRNRPSLKEKAMFRKLRSPRFLKSGANEREAWIGFVGDVARLASVHQHGLSEEPAKGQKAVNYAMRQLLGLSIEDREDLLDSVLKHLAD